MICVIWTIFQNLSFIHLACSQHFIISVLHDMCLTVLANINIFIIK